MIAAILTLLTLTACPLERSLIDYVDVIELNHVHSETGHPYLHQWIFWHWNHAQRRYEVVAWRRVGYEHYYWRGKTLRFIDGVIEGKVEREIRAVSFRETWTFDDPEVADRQVLEIENRRGLMKSPRRLTIFGRPIPQNKAAR